MPHYYGTASAAQRNDCDHVEELNEYLLKINGK